MIHEFDDALRADPERFELARRAAAILDDDTRFTVVPAHARWGLPSMEMEVPIFGKAFLEVELKDHIGTDYFTPLFENEVENLLELRYRIARLWGDFLEQRTNAMIIKYTQPAPELEMSGS